MTYAKKKTRVKAPTVTHTNTPSPQTHSRLHAWLVFWQSIWGWIDISLVAIVGNILQILLRAVTFPFDRNHMLTGRWFRDMGWVAAKLMPQWKFAVYGPFPRHIKGKTIVVSNHTSQADPFLISHLPWEMKWMGKSSLFRIPFIGWAMHLAGDVPVLRGDRIAVQKAMQQCAVYLQRNVPVFIFPEGTRSADGDLLPFRDGAFRLAIETGADILPLAVAGTRNALPKHAWRFGTARALVTVGNPITTQGMTLANLDELKQAAHAQIVSLLRIIRPLTTSAPSSASSHAP